MFHVRGVSPHPFSSCPAIAPHLTGVAIRRGCGPKRPRQRRGGVPAPKSTDIARNVGQQIGKVEHVVGITFTASRLWDVVAIARRRAPSQILDLEGLPLLTALEAPLSAESPRQAHCVTSAVLHGRPPGEPYAPVAWRGVAWLAACLPLGVGERGASGRVPWLAQPLARGSTPRRGSCVAFGVHHVPPPPPPGDGA